MIERCFRDFGIPPYPRCGLSWRARSIPPYPLPLFNRVIVTVVTFVMVVTVSKRSETATCSDGKDILKLYKRL